MKNSRRSRHPTPRQRDAWTPSEWADVSPTVAKSAWEPHRPVPFHFTLARRRSLSPHGAQPLLRQRRRRRPLRRAAHLRHHRAPLHRHHPGQPAHHPGHRLQPAAPQHAQLLLPQPAGGGPVHRRGAALHPPDGPQPPAELRLLPAGARLPQLPVPGLPAQPGDGALRALHLHRQPAALQPAVGAPPVPRGAAGGVGASAAVRGAARLRLEQLVRARLGLLLPGGGRRGFRSRAPGGGVAVRRQRHRRHLLLLPASVPQRLHLPGGVRPGAARHPGRGRHDGPRAVDHARPAARHLPAAPLAGAGRARLGPRAAVEPAVRALRGGRVAGLPGVLAAVHHLHARVRGVPAEERHALAPHRPRRAVVHGHRQHGRGAAGAGRGQPAVHRPGQEDPAEDPGPLEDRVAAAAASTAAAQRGNRTVATEQYVV